MSNTNAIVWFDMYVHDMKRAVDFYQTVLDQELTPLGDPTGDSEMMSFPMNDESMGKYGALGALVKMEGGNPGVGGTIVYFGSDDCVVEQSRVEAAGGKVIRPKFSIGDYGWIALCEDTEGNLFGFNSMK